MNLKIDIEQNGNENYVFINGEIDAFTAPKLRESLIPLSEESGSRIIADLSGVNYMDSTGLGVFIGTYKSSQKHGVSLKLTGMTARIERLFEITGLTEILDIEAVRGETQ